MNKHIAKHLTISLLAAIFGFAASGYAATTDLATQPMAVTSSASIKPNLLFLLDDSGSMAWDRLSPDTMAQTTDSSQGTCVAGTTGQQGSCSCNMNSTFNGVYYNPSSTYVLPVNSNGSNYSNSTFTAAKYNGFDSASSSINLNTGFTTGGGSNNDISGPGAFYYTYHPTATLTVSGSTTTTTSATGITVNGAQIMSAASATSTSTSTVASNIASKINLCTAALSGNCTVTGYSATVSGSKVTINGPTAAGGYTPVITKTGSMTLTAAAFTPATPVTGTCYPDANYTRVNLTSTSTEAQNFANWYSYYRTRMQTMKSAVGRAFKNIDSTYRVGFATINSIDNATPLVVPISDFDATQRATWYSNFYAIVPNNSTPLRVALANAGRMYAHKLTGAADPMQYSCQQNFTIMTTDGMWNEAINPKQIDGVTDIGNQDNTAPRPMYDGSSYTKTTKQNQQNTSTIYQNTVQLQANQIQSSTSTLQSSTSNLQSTVYPLQSSTSYLQKQISQLQSQTSTLQGTLSQALMKCSSTAAACGTAPATGIAGVGSGTASWTVVASGTCTVAANVQCAQVSGLSGSVNVATSCNTTAGITTTGGTNATATLTFTGASGASVTSIKINGTEILTSSTSSSSSNNTVASSVVTNIGNGFTASRSSNVVTITAPAGTNITANPTVTKSGTLTIGYSFTSSTAPTAYTLNNADSNGNIYSSCSYTAWSTGTGTASCTAVAKSGSSPYTVLTAKQCSTVITTPYANATSCTVSATPDASGNTTQCQYTTPVTAATSSCIYQVRSGASPYTVATETICSYGTTPVVTNVSSCIPVAYTTNTANGTNWDSNAKTCGYSAYSTPANASSCTPVAKSGASPYTVGVAINCSYTAYTPWANTSSCTAAAPSPAPPYTVGVATQCQNVWQGVNTCTAGTGGQTACQTVTASNPVASCTPATASSGNNWTTTSCSTTTTPWVGVSTCTAAAASSSNNYTATNCNSANPVTGTTNVTSCTPSSATAANNWTTTTCSGLTGGTPNTLADVAYYYWQTDLRTTGLGNCTGVLGTDVCYDNVRGSGDDVNSQQHMTTFTLGLGVVGTLNPDGYPTLSTDYNNLVTGPNNWSAPVSNTNTTIDDLWHAAVNGRGVYFSAKSPDSLVTGLSQSLEGVKNRQGASAAASTSNLQPVQNDNFAYVALFNTNSWDGDLLSKQIDPVTSRFVKDPVNTTQDLIVWSAQDQLDLLVSAASDTRTIYTFDSSTSNKLKAFTWANLNSAEQGYFNNMCSSPYKLSQCSTLIANDTANATTTATAASGANLVNFLRGQHGYEDVVTNTNKIYRTRTHVLGDIVNAQPQYLKKPPFDYNDIGYVAFQAAQANRTPMVYSASNDGMLHAFNAVTGVEQWAYIPPMVMSNLYLLASKDYSNNHRYFVDGTPTIAEICPTAPASTCTGAQWKDILVGGLNGGGRGYYALDVTDPANPQALWNFTVDSTDFNKANLGYTYGNPVVAKRKDSCTTLSGVTTCKGGTWVVAVTSGYNNVSPGDGKGHLFVLNAWTGALLEDIPTTAGNTTTPSGLSKINAWINYANDNTTERFYGGDLLGNVWRFDIDNNVLPAGKEALLLAQLGQVDLPNAQPITTEPGLAEVDDGGNAYAGIFVATGRYLGVSDLANTDQQSIYGLKDNLTATGLGLVRTPGTLVQQTLNTYTSGGNSYRSGTNNAVDWTAKSGWYVDLNPGGDSPGERVNVDLNMQQKTLSLVGNVPNNNACNTGGYSWLYYFNFKSGYLPGIAGAGAGAAAAAGGIKDSSNSLIAGTTQIMDSSGKTHTIVTHTDGTITIQDDKIPPPPPSFPRRSSWRELVN